MELEDQVLGRLVEEYHRRVAQGERPSAEDFREEAGECYARFVDVLQQEQLLDSVLEGTKAEKYPRTFGEYTLLELLGRGGIGNVYKAVHRPLSRTVALKVLQGGWADEPELVERFKRGARAAAQVEHPHVVRIYDVGVFEGRPFIAMSLLPGISLQEVFRKLRAAGPPPFGPAHHAVLDEFEIPGEGAHTDAFARRLAGILAGPVEALKEYHEAGIIHRDVKPGNLLLDEEGRLVLTDFDLARRLETNFQTQSGGHLGTPGYMSPEQWDPLVPDVDARADLYAFGCVLFEGFTQRPPFHDADPSRMMKRILQERAPDAGTLSPGLPPSAKRVVAKALERRREDRYQTAQEFARDLRALATGAEVAARPVPKVKRAARWGWGKKWAVVAAVVVAASLLWLFNRPATLHIDPRPAADIWVDDVNLGRSPITSYKVASGVRIVRIERTGFKPEVVHLKVGAGTSELVNPRLVVVDEKNPEVLKAFYEQTGIRLPDLEVSGERSGSTLEGVALPLFPRGKVRRADLNNYVAETYRAIEGDVVFLDDADNELFATAAIPDLGAVKQPFTEELLAKLETDRSYRWGLRVDGEMTPLATFTVVAEPDPERILKVRDVVTHPMLRDLFEAGFYAKEGLYVAAFRKAFDGYDRHQNKEFLAFAWRALESLELEKSGYGQQLMGLYASARSEED